MTKGRHLFADCGEEHQKQEECLYRVYKAESTGMFEMREEKPNVPGAYRPLSHRCFGLRGGVGQILQGYANVGEDGA